MMRTDKAREMNEPNYATLVKETAMKERETENVEVDAGVRGLNQPTLRLCPKLAA